MLRCPQSLIPRAEKSLQSLALANPPLLREVGARIIVDWRADDLRHRVGAELENRNRLARQLLGVVAFAGHGQCAHVWIPVSDANGLPDLVASLARQGIWVASTRDFAVTEAEGAAGLRLALGSTAHRHKIADVCNVLRRLLSGSVPGIV
jgi:DNA-binding transcriptional MocR family regulator